MNKQLVIVGASGHGKVVADIGKLNGYSSIVFLDDGKVGQQCAGCSVMGTSKDAEHYMNSDFIVAIGDAAIREKIQIELTRMGCHLVSLIHPDAVVAENVKIGIGSVVMAGAVINPEVVIGKGCIINTCASVDHECQVGDYVHIAVGAHVCGMVRIGTGTWVGAGATIINNLYICGRCMIGAGATVIENLKDSGVYVGVPIHRVKNKG